jgi:hypothetical protein
MNPLSDTLTLIWGTDNAFTVNIETSAGSPDAGVTGKLYLTIKKNMGDSYANALLQVPVTFTTDSYGNTTIAITHTQSQLPIGTYWYDLTVIINGQVTRSFPGKCQVVQSVTDAVS